jgi:hypothetical protein
MIIYASLVQLVGINVSIIVCCMCIYMLHMHIGHLPVVEGEGVEEEVAVEQLEPVCVYVCVYVYVCVLCVYVFLYMCMCFVLCVYICMCVYVYVYVCMCYVLCVYVCMCMCVYVYVCMCVCVEQCEPVPSEEARRPLSGRFFPLYVSDIGVVSVFIQYMVYNCVYYCDTLVYLVSIIVSIVVIHIYNCSSPCMGHI